MRKLTERERRALEYLSPLMEATGQMVGRAILGDPTKPQRGAAIIGNRTCKELYYLEPPLVAFVPEWRAWAITPAGRAALAEGER